MFGIKPQSVMKYEGLNPEGLSDLILHRTPGGSGVTSIGYKGNHDQRGRGLFGTYVAFTLDQSWVGLPPQTILDKLGTQLEPQEDANKKLTQIINQRANELRLPDGCAVTDPSETHRVIWDDALTVLAILTKCTHSVWLRNKNPSLVIPEHKRTVSLLIPPLFELFLPEQT